MTPRLLSSAAVRHAICRLLVVSFVCFLLFPFHYHLHHVDDPLEQGTGHAHVTDLHAHLDAGGLDHHADSHTLKPAPDSALKAPGGHPWVVILMAVVLLLPFLALARQPLPIPPSYRLPRCYRHTTPPLRAPPRH